MKRLGISRHPWRRYLGKWRGAQGHITEQKYGGVYLRRDGRHTGTDG
jgi:hypothetical protein